MLVNKQLGYKNNSNLANSVEIDEGYRQKKNYSFKSPFSLFSYEMFGCLFNSQVIKNETEKKPHLCSHLHNF